jgi:3-keto-disaccharide hydrolase
VQLFNGKDIDGWKTHPDQPGKWEIKDGAITCSGPASHLFSEREYENFHLRVQAKINRDGNSGAGFRSAFGKWWDGKRGKTPQGYEAQIIGNPNFNFKTSRLFHEHEIACVNETHMRPDEWFTMEVIANENRITILVEGKTAIEFVDPATRPMRGHFALLHASSKTAVHFKKIEIKEFPGVERLIAISGTPRLRKTIDAKNRVGYAAFSSDSQSLIVAGDALDFYDTTTGEAIHHEKLHDRVNSALSLSKDRKTLAVVQKDTALVFDLPVRKVPLQSKIGPGFLGRTFA